MATEEMPESRSDIIDECTATPLGRTALELARKRGAFQDPGILRSELHAQLIDIADAYDSMDHRIAPMGSEIQDDCQSVRELARSLSAEL